MQSMQLPSPGNERAFKKCDKVHTLWPFLPDSLLIPKSLLKEVILKEYFVKINRDMEFTMSTQGQHDYRKDLFGVQRGITGISHTILTSFTNDTGIWEGRNMEARNWKTILIPLRNSDTRLCFSKIVILLWKRHDTQLFWQGRYLIAVCWIRAVLGSIAYSVVSRENLYKINNSVIVSCSAQASPRL